MSEHQKNEDRKTLPKPVALTPQEVEQVAAGYAAYLPPPTLFHPLPQIDDGFTS
jgi:hypothetical protein